MGLRSHVFLCLAAREWVLLGQPIMRTAVHSSKPFAEPVSKVCAFDKASVCLLDDDLSMLKALDRLLKAEGFRVEKFNNPTAFLSAMQQDGCTIAILDVWMPEMSGLEVQSVLRKDSPETRIIFISGRDDPSVRRAALDAGAFGFLSKPFDDETLLQLVRNAIAA
jgi:FixJ family two-component response regulator